MAEWQPIATMPKDGTRIDVCVRDKTGVTRRITDCHFTKSIYGWDELNGWYDMTLLPFEYLGWMPLPNPPPVMKDDRGE
jgi:hypothetical protein